MVKDNSIKEKKYVMGKYTDRRRQYAVSPTGGQEMFMAEMETLKWGTNFLNFV